MSSTKSSSTTRRRASGFTAEERAAMKERAREMKAQGAGNDDGEGEVLAKIAEMGSDDRAIAERIHRIMKDTIPGVSPRTWYGMPAYAKDGKVVCFFKPAAKFKSRYATFGFSDKATLDDGVMWATEFALLELTDAAEKQIVALVKRAIRE